MSHRKLSNPTAITGDAYQRILFYWKLYGKKYERPTKLMLRSELLPFYTETKDVPAIFLAIYAHLGLLADNQNYYQSFLKFLNEYYNNLFDQKVLEVGCGEYPVFTEMYAQAKKENRGLGTISGMDKNLIIDSLPGVQLLRENFNLNTNLSNYDIICGMYTCDATPLIFERACAEKKEAAVLLCGCLHPINNQSFKNFDEYLNFLYRYIKSNKDSEFIFDQTYLNDQIDTPYPILSLKRK